MTIDQYIFELEKIKRAHGGDVHVYKLGFVGGYHVSGYPRVEYLAIPKGRETNQRLWCESDNPRFKREQGQKVVIV